ncbi:MAG: hypothetical protein AAFP68_09870 [Pseudomonadota bacterium]
MRPFVRACYVISAVCLAIAMPASATTAPHDEVRNALRSLHPTAGAPFVRSTPLSAADESAASAENTNVVAVRSAPDDGPDLTQFDDSAEIDEPDYLQQFEAALPIPPLAFYLISAFVCIAVISARRRQIENASSHVRFN